MLNKNLAHSIHSFANCVGCHMPRIAKSAESGDIHSHVFVTLLPEDTLRNPVIPNSCQTCHKHKDADLKKLQEEYDALVKLPKPVGTAVKPLIYE
jgi:formate-dependent nitrite reductase cytochrome c552 subunit